MSGQLFDISPAIDLRLRVWPGDTEPSREVLLDIARGDHLTLSTLRTTVHAGAHADHEHIVIDPSLDRCALLARLMLSPAEDIG